MSPILMDRCASTGRAIFNSDATGPRLLVTGGAGFVLSNLVHHWLASDATSSAVIFDQRRAWDASVQAFLGEQRVVRVVQIVQIVKSYNPALGNQQCSRCAVGCGASEPCACICALNLCWGRGGGSWMLVAQCHAMLCLSSL